MHSLLRNASTKPNDPCSVLSDKKIISITVICKSCFLLFQNIRLSVKIALEFGFQLFVIGTLYRTVESRKPSLALADRAFNGSLFLLGFVLLFVLFQVNGEICTLGKPLEKRKEVVTTVPAF